MPIGRKQLNINILNDLDYSPLLEIIHISTIDKNSSLSEYIENLKTIEINRNNNIKRIIDEN